MHNFFEYLKKNQVILALFIITLGLFLWQIRSLVILVFVALILMSALLPIFEWLQERRVPRLLAAALSVILILILAAGLLVPGIRVLWAQGSEFLEAFPRYVSTVSSYLGVQLDLEQVRQVLSERFNQIAQNTLSVVGSVFGGLFSTLSLLFITFYLLFDHEAVIKGLSGLWPKNRQSKAKETFLRIEDKLGAWFRGQLVLSTSVGLLNALAFIILGLPYVLPLALFTALMEIVPTIGPVIGYIPVVILALSRSPIVLIGTLIAYAIVQVLEGNLLVPQVMKRAVGLHPLIVLLGVIAGAELMGIVGALLAVPVLTVVQVLVLDKEAEE